MPGLIILIILVVYLGLRLKNLWDNKFTLLYNGYLQTQDDYKKILAEEQKLKGANSALEGELEARVTLYDLTKDISKPLDPERVFDVFRNEINKYISIETCEFLKGKLRPDKYADCLIYPLEIGQRPLGYLLAGGIKEEDKDKFGILAQQFILAVKRAVLYQRVQQAAISDNLTGLANRRYYLERFNEEIKRCQKFKYSLSLLMIDIDHFKKYNDCYGHLTGDAILKDVAGLIKESTRQIDLVARYGGEEFSVALVQTNKEKASSAAGRIRQNIEHQQIKADGEDLKVTVSIGVATYPLDAPDLATLIEKADQALYQAKSGGRNRVRKWENPLQLG